MAAVCRHLERLAGFGILDCAGQGVLRKRDSVLECGVSPPLSECSLQTGDYRAFWSYRSPADFN
jgi:hypothetical protein